jgi:hypothetical protein
MKQLIAVLLLATSSTLLADDYTCTSGTSKRFIRVQYEDPNSLVPCQVVYEKETEGTTETAWQAQREVGYCERKAKQLARSLTRYGWLCVTPVRSDPSPVPVFP